MSSTDSSQIVNNAWNDARVQRADEPKSAAEFRGSKFG
jgi:hypothetical protein